MMPFDPSPDRHDQILTSYLVEYLGVQPARMDGDQVIAVLTLRLSPATTFLSHNISLTQAQAIRLRDDLNSLLTTPESWLFAGREDHNEQ